MSETFLVRQQIRCRTLEFKILSSFQKRWLKQEKNLKKWNFYTKSVFDKIDIGFWCNSKKLTVDSFNFH